jgi:DNA (cytosine-5)-methyltransferase 1
MRLLDLFCGAGGAAMGYHRAGFEVVGVDIKPQPNYPFEFIQADALEVPLGGFDLVHASPPCQAFTAYKRRPNHVQSSPNLILATRDRLRSEGIPYVIENVPGAPLIERIQLCGSAFGLGVRRHRLFESTLPLWAPPCAHGAQQGSYPQATNRVNRRRTAEIGVWRIPLADQQEAMGIDWMTLEELSEAIPPSYTEFIGDQLREQLERDMTKKLERCVFCDEEHEPEGFQDGLRCALCAESTSYKRSSTT